MKNSTLIIAILFAAVFVAQAQLEIGVKATPSITNYQTRYANLSYDHTFQFNYGLELNYRYKRFVFTTGLIHLTQGARTEVPFTTVSMPEGSQSHYDVFLRATTVAIPLRVDYYFWESKRTSLYFGVGILSGIVYSQQQENTSIPHDWQPEPDVIYLHDISRFSDLDIFDEVYIGLNIGLGWRHQLSDHLSLQLRPNFLFQLRRDRPEPVVFTFRKVTWGLDVGVFFRIWNAY